MNPTRITEERSETLRRFYKSHHKFSSRDKAHAKLTLRLDVDIPFDIHTHNVQITINGKLHQTKAIAITGGYDSKRTLKQAL
eukprot:14789468-Ditylum_brightwellii.AAC.1